MVTKLGFKTATTNTINNSCVEQKCTCITWWQLMQQNAFIRLANKKKTDANGQAQYQLEEHYIARAQRIAATYARFYLEIERDGNEKKKGRYYWMGLGAFASKTLSCVFSDPRIDLTYRVGEANSMHVLAKGNLWLFMDIAPWHWGHNKSPASFDQCRDERDSTQFTVPQVKETLQSMPWANALPKMKNFKSTPEIKKAFDLIKDNENESNNTQREYNQFQHLMAIAKHEQLNVLQEICWKDYTMVRDAKSQRQQAQAFYGALVPANKLVFSTACHFPDEDLLEANKLTTEEVISLAPENMVVENFDSRMEWIVKAAKQYHKLMITKQKYMEGELRAIAEWVNNKGFGNVTSDSNDPAPSKK